MPVEPRKRGQMIGYASFQSRGTPWWSRLLMDLADALIVLFGALLWVGGRPLRWLLIGTLAGLLRNTARGMRRVVLINLDLAYGETIGEAEKQRIMRGMFRHFARTLLDFFFEDVYWPAEKLRARTTPDHSPAVEQALQGGHGYALAGPHLGHLELLQRLVACAGYESYILYKGQKGAWFDRLVARKRLKHGNGLIEIASSRHMLVNGKTQKLPRSSIRPDVQMAFDRNAAVGFACDQYTRRGGIDLTILGVPNTPTAVGALRYVIERRIPITLQTLVYEDDNHFRWIDGGPLHIEDQGGPDATLRFYVQKVNDWFEEQIRKYPDQYAWGHRRFRRDYYKMTRPVRADSLTQQATAAEDADNQPGADDE